VLVDFEVGVCARISDADDDRVFQLTPIVEMPEDILCQCERKIRVQQIDDGKAPAACGLVPRQADQQPECVRSGPARERQHICIG
jgi:hypothetical protein